MNKPSIFQRTHEWAADNFSWVQYPNVSMVNQHAYKPKLAFHMRVGLFVFAIVVLIICAIALFFIGLLLWAVVTA